MLVKKIDVHIHTDMWNGNEIPRYDGTRFATPEELIDMYDKLGIEKGILLPCMSPELAFSVQSNEKTHEIAEKYKDLFYWFCSIDPRFGYNNPKNDLSHFLNHYKQMGARGVGELAANLYTDEPLLDNLFYHCAECDMPVTIHIAPDRYGHYGIIDELGLPRLEKMLKKYPTLKILGHSMMFWSAISGNVTVDNMNGYPTGKVTEGGRLIHLFREYENLYGDMSAGSGYNAISRDVEFSYKFIDEFQDKLLFGTDICRPGQEIYQGIWLDKAYSDSNISATAYKKISRNNAIKLLNLECELA